MSTLGSIRYLQNHEIDRVLWDECMDKAENSLIYGYSFYLDAMCDHWDGLVLGNYEMVMALPWRRKYGILYLYQPYYTATLGVFGNDLSEDVIMAFLKAIPIKFLYWDLNFNEKNRISSTTFLPNLELQTRRNIFLQLTTYEKIYSKYSRLAKRKLVKAKAEGLLITRNVPVEIVINCYITEYEKKNRIIPNSDYDKLKEGLSHFKKDQFQTYLACTSTNEIVAFYLIYIDQRFVYSILGGSSEIGKRLGAFYFLTDAAIQDFSGTHKTFRFEGSDIPGIAFFDLQFGSYPIDYLHLKHNNLPWPVKWLKS